MVTQPGKFLIFKPERGHAPAMVIQPSTFLIFTPGHSHAPGMVTQPGKTLVSIAWHGKPLPPKHTSVLPGTMTLSSLPVDLNPA